MSKLVKGIGLGALLVGTVALAQPASAQTSTNSASAALASTATTAGLSEREPPKYCLRYPRGSTRIMTKSCLTEREWDHHGIELIFGKKR